MDHTYRAQYFGKGHRFVWSRIQPSYEAALAKARAFAAMRGVEARVWSSNRAWDTTQPGQDLLVCFVSPNGTVIDRDSN